jgi:hypothetical protein
MIARKRRTTQREKIRKLRALGRSPNKHEAALALAKAQELESKTPNAKAIAHAIAQLLEASGVRVCVRRRSNAEGPWSRSKVDAHVRYHYRRRHNRQFSTTHQIEVEVTVYE